MFETLKDDLRFTGRLLRKSPVFTAVAVSCSLPQRDGG